MPAPNTWETVESILPRGRKIVLDLGCGEQLEIDHIWEFSGYEVHRCDIRDFKNVPYFTICDLNQKFPYKDNEFDGVVAVEIIEHLENPRHFLRECKRVAKEFIVLTTPNCCSPESKARFNETCFFKYFDIHKPYGHITPVFPWMIHQICDELNLRIKIETFNNQATKEIYIIYIDLN